MKSIKVSEITSPVIFKDLKSCWRSLLLDQSHLSFFLSWEWMHTWWHHYAAINDKLCIFIFEEGYEIIGIAPLYIQNNKTIRFIGTGEPESEEVASEYLDIICSIDNTKPIVKLLSSRLNRKLQTVFTLEVNNYIKNSAIDKTLALIKGKFWQHISLSGVRYQAYLANGFENYQRNCSKSLIKKLTRHKNKFQLHLNGRITPYHSREKYVDGLNILSSLHSKRWENKGLSGAFTSEKFINFHHQFCLYAIEYDWLQIYTLEAKDKTIAAIYNISFQETTYFYQMGIDTDFKPNLSPGFLIHFLLIEQSANEKKHFYDLMKGNEEDSYKSNISDVHTKMFNAIILKKNKFNFFRILKLQVKKLKGFIINGKTVSTAGRR